MSFAYSPVQPVATGSTVASAPVNLGFSQIASAFNQHQSGSAYGHVLNAGTGGVATGSAIQGTTAAASGATDLWTMLDRLANAVGVLATGSSVAGSWLGLGNIAGAASGVNNATSAATALAMVRRDVTAGAAFGPLTGMNFVGLAIDSAHAGVYARGASGNPSQYIFAVQNNAGTVNDFTVDDQGNAVARGRVTATADAVIGTVLWAGSAVTQVTDATGKVNQAALPVVNSAHGGMGVDLTVGGNLPTARALLGAAASGANADITSLTGLTTPLGPGVGGTGLVNPAAGSIPVTNGSGNWLLLPPTPANYFVVSNGSTYVAQAFQTSMIPSGALNQSVMSSLYPSAGTGAGNLLKAQAQPWSGFINGTWVAFAGGTANYSPAIDPTGIGVGQSRIDLLVLNAAGNLAWSVGTPSATPSMAATPLPTNAAPIWYVKVYPGATQITGYTDAGSQAAFIQDARNLFGPTTAVAGTAGAPATLPAGLYYATFGDATATVASSKRLDNKFWAYIGTDADLTAETDVTGLFRQAQTGVINTVDTSLPRLGYNKIASDVTYATFDDFLNVAVSGNVAAAITTAGGAISMRTQPGQPPIWVRTGGKEQKCDSTATITTNTVTVAGAYILVADLNGTGNRFTIQLVASIGSLQVGLQKMWFDGATLYNTTPHGPVELTKPSINGYNYVPTQQMTAYYSATGFSAALAANSGTGVAPLPSTTPLVFDLADGNMTAWIEIYGHILSTATAGDFRVYAMMSTGLNTPLSYRAECYAEYSPMPASATYPFFAKCRIPNLGPGWVNFGLGYYAVPANYILALPTIFVRFER